MNKTEANSALECAVWWGLDKCCAEGLQLGRKSALRAEERTYGRLGSLGVVLETVIVNGYSKIEQKLAG
jgi:hypothetical protein